MAPFVTILVDLGTNTGALLDANAGPVRPAGVRPGLILAPRFRLRLRIGALTAGLRADRAARRLRRFEREAERILIACDAVGRGAPELLQSPDQPGRGDSPARIAVLGEFSAGKSSLLNALLGHRLLATGLVETTEVPTLIEFGERIEIFASREQGDETPIDAEAMSTSTARRSAPTGTSAFRLTAPAPLLRRLSIVDTPGSNTPTKKHRDEASGAAAACAAWLFATRAEQALRKSEIDWLVDHGARHRAFVVALTQADRLTSRDASRALHAARRRLREAGLRHALVLSVSVEDPESLRRVAGAMVLVCRLNERFASLRTETARHCALSDAWRRSSQEIRAELEARFAANDAKVARAEEARACTWLQPRLREIDEFFSALRVESAQLIDSQYAERIKAVAKSEPSRAELQKLPSVAGLAARVRTLADRYRRELGRILSHPPPALPTGPLPAPVSQLDPKANYVVAPYVHGHPPGFGFWSDVVSLFQEPQASRRRKREEWRCFLESERTRYGSYIRSWLVGRERELSNALQRTADDEMSAAARELTALEEDATTIARQQARVELLIQRYATYFDETRQP